MIDQVMIFAQVVSLLADYSASRKGHADDERAAFEEWLSSQRHDEVLSLLRENQGVGIAVKAILNQDRAEVGARFGKLDAALAEIASAIDGFGALAHAIRPDATLSDQAVDVLRQFVAMNGTRLAFMEVDWKIQLHCMDGAQGELTFAEPRLIEDDVAQLVASGFLRLEYSRGGSEQFRITRRAVEFVKASVTT